ncbi:DUF3472 domain-containing protein [Duganella fentianensis]|nr:DUF5077 domain-containing protein [Duganella fentianensis]
MQGRSLLYSALMWLCLNSSALAQAAAPAAQPVPTITVALAGNAFVVQAPDGAQESIEEQGLTHWSNPAAVISTYFRMQQAGTLTLALDARLQGIEHSTIRVTVNGQPFTVALAGSTVRSYAVGSIAVAAPGYVRVDLQGVSKDGSAFGEVSALKVTTASPLAYASEAENYYWSRRGPSVHLNYSTPNATEYFYNEMSIPEGQDTLGSYFMANGFRGGYFGIQVNSPSERWILFSVWDAQNGERTTLVRKGEGVVDNNFGGEGTGGQSYLVFNWKAGTTYRFITRGQPDGHGATLYSAWFYAPELRRWRFIATWKRPATVSYLAGNHSFLENFEDTQGYAGRRVLYGNQWARDSGGVWSEVTTARLTGDMTARKAQRMDYAGGLEGGRFYLRNCGFFNDYVGLDQSFTRPAAGQPPQVDVASLPQ